MTLRTAIDEGHHGPHAALLGGMGDVEALDARWETAQSQEFLQAPAQQVVIAPARILVQVIKRHAQEGATRATLRHNQAHPSSGRFSQQFLQGG